MTFQPVVLETTRGRGVAGVAVGILHIASPFPLLPGNPQNAGSFNFPVLYECVEGLSPAAVMSGDPCGAAPLLAAAQRLQDAGVRIIVGSCGSFANFQSLLISELEIPVYASVMTLVPHILAGLPAGRRLAMVFADIRSCTPKVLAECLVTEPVRIAPIGCQDLPRFRPLIEGRTRFEAEAFRSDFMAFLAAELGTDSSIGAVMLQCSELAPYAADVAGLLGLPVYDGAALVRWAHSAVAPPAPTGQLFNVRIVGPEP